MVEEKENQELVILPHLALEEKKPWVKKLGKKINLPTNISFIVVKNKLIYVSFFKKTIKR
jgi:hypothetical protein